MKYVRMPIEEESPEQFGYDRIKYNLAESSVSDRSLRDLGLNLDDTLLCYGDHVFSFPIPVQLIFLKSQFCENLLTIDEIKIEAFR
ncbi:MAG: hypothetical protein WCC06_13850 [Candidatus Aminicenantales bacterium]